MRAKMTAENPGAIEFTLSVTMKASEWQTLHRQISDSPAFTSWPLSSFRNHISDVIQQSRKSFSTAGEDAPTE